MNIVLWTPHTTANFWTKQNSHIFGKDANFQYEIYSATQQCPALYNCPNLTKNWEFFLDYTGIFSGFALWLSFGLLKEALGGQRFDDNIAVEAFLRNWLVSQPLFYDSGIKILSNSIWKKLFLRANCSIFWKILPVK